MGIEEIEERRAKRKEATAKARAEQYEIDLAEVDKIEAELGDDHVKILHTPSFAAGLPTLVVVRMPTSALFNRFRQQVRKAGQKTEAIGNAKDMLAAECVVYPAKDIYDRMREEWPSIHDSVGIEAIQLVEAEGGKN